MPPAPAPCVSLDIHGAQEDANPSIHDPEAVGVEQGVIDHHPSTPQMSGDLEDFGPYLAGGVLIDLAGNRDGEGPIDGFGILDPPDKGDLLFPDFHRRLSMESRMGPEVIIAFDPGAEAEVEIVKGSDFKPKILIKMIWPEESFKAGPWRQSPCQSSPQ